MSYYPFLNVAFYKFAALENLEDLRAHLRSEAQRLELKGTVLLSAEGFNGFFAGLESNVREFLNLICSKTETALETLPIKKSFSSGQPYNRMLVKVKKEIISMGMPSIQPHVKTGKYLAPNILKKWLDEKKEVILLDTRNDYEIRIGTFKGAVDLRIKHFRHFPKSVDDQAPQLQNEWKNKPVVTFCTGGIRCEKASAYLMEKGFQDVYQLDGGILNYFKENGGEHFLGDCFVFDQRVAVDGNLKETSIAQCYACRNPLTIEEQKSSNYIAAVSCPYCAEKSVD